MLGLLSHIFSAISHLTSRFLNRFRSKAAQAAKQRQLLDRVKRVMNILSIKAIHHDNVAAASQSSMSQGAALSKIAPAGATPPGSGHSAAEAGAAAPVVFSSTHKTNKEETEVDQRTGRKRKRGSRSGRNLSRSKGRGKSK